VVESHNLQRLQFVNVIFDYGSTSDSQRTGAEKTVFQKFFPVHKMGV
jgi:hypothetical protein